MNGPSSGTGRLGIRPGSILRRTHTLVSTPPLTCVEQQEPRSTMASQDRANPDEGDVYLLFVLDSVPIAVINEVLDTAFNETGEYILRLADESSIADQETPLGTETPVNSDWTSPFVGKDIREAAAIVESVPQPLNRQHFAVLDPSVYQQIRKVMVYKIVDGEPQGIPCTVEETSLHLLGYDRGTWAESWRNWQEKGRSL
ncbi:hypothetical protein BST61_g7264 [Cercospora zeina]